MAPFRWLDHFHTASGYLSYDREGTNRLADEYVLQALFHQAVGLVSENAVDIDVVRRRTESHTSVKIMKVLEFSQALWDRGRACVFSGWDGQACHIIPFAQGSERRFIQAPINDINDERNGYTCSDLSA
ncbi:hypothetical protein BDN71DRAFT_1438247, partial [Pleurotus eryngii]